MQARVLGGQRSANSGAVHGLLSRIRVQAIKMSATTRGTGLQWTSGQEVGVVRETANQVDRRLYGWCSFSGIRRVE